MINIFNSVLITFVFDDKKQRYALVGSIFILQIFILILSQFIFDENTKWHSLIAILIAVLYTFILVPVFLYLTNAIMEETLQEAKHGNLMKN